MNLQPHNTVPHRLSSFQHTGLPEAGCTGGEVKVPAGKNLETRACRTPVHDLPGRTGQGSTPAAGDGNDEVLTRS